MMAKEKSPIFTGESSVPWYYWLTAHAAIHAGMVALITGSVWLWLAEYACHLLMDLAKCLGKTNIHTDQAIHLLCKVAWVAML